MKDQLVLPKIIIINIINFVFNACKKDTIYNLLSSLNYGDKDRWYYIPSHNYQIENLITDIFKNNKLEKKRFIDIGCGYPAIGKMLQIMGYDPKNIFGLEYNQNIIDVIKNSHSIIPLNGNDRRIENNIINGDLMNHNFKTYDILYSYNPLKRGDDMLEGINNIIKTMKKGAIFYFSNASISHIELEKLGFNRFATEPSLYKYIKE